MRSLLLTGGEDEGVDEFGPTFAVNARRAMAKRRE